MIKLAIDYLHLEHDERLKRYIEQKIGQLDHFLPKNHRSSARAEVKLKKGPGRGQKQIICEVIIALPKARITTKQASVSEESAVDLAEAALKNQIKKYKDKHGANRGRRLLSRVRPKYR